MLPTNTGTPPVGVVYQSTVSPGPAFTISAGVAVPSQITGKLGPLGAVMGGQVQLGAATDCSKEQPVVVIVAVSITLVPFGMFVMLKLEPLPLTVPAEEIMVFALEVRLME